MINFKKICGISSRQCIMKTVFSNIGMKVHIPEKKLIKSEINIRIGEYYQLCMLYHKTYHVKLHDKLFYKKKRMKYLSISEMSKILDVLKNKCLFDVEFVSIIVWRKKYINL